MEFKKILEQTDRYDIVQWESRGMPITSRIWRGGSQIVETRADERFAKINGYKPVDDITKNTIGKAKFEELFGDVPGWIRASPNEDFTFVDISPTLYS